MITGSKKKLGLLILAFFLSLSTIKAQDVSPLEQSSFDLRGTVLIDTVTVPLKLDPNVNINDVQLLSDTPFIVRSGNKNSQFFKDAIRVYINHQQPVINLVVNMKMLNMQGTYDVSIAYVAKNKPVQLLKIALLRPAAIIDTVSTVYIYVTGSKITADPFVLNAEKSQSDILVLQLSHPYFLGINRGDLVTFSSAEYSIKAGRYFKADYTFDKGLVSSLPLGIIRGKLQVMSPEMVSPIIVNFEIFKRRAKIWIIIAVFVGLLFGVFVRYFLKDKKESERLKLKGLDLVNQITSETNKITDEEFRDAIGKLLADLSPFLKSGTGLSRFTGREDKPLAAKIDETVTKYNTLKDAFQTQLKTQKDALKDLSGSFEDGTLCDALKSSLTEAFNSYHKAKLHLVNLNPSAAENDINRAITIMGKLIKKFSEYYQTLADLMKQDNFYPNSINTPVKDAIKKYITSILENLPKIKTEPSNAKTMTDAVINFDVIIETKDKMMAYIFEMIPQIFKYGSGLKGSPEEVAFQKVLEEWQAMVNNIGVNPRNTNNAVEYFDTTIVQRFDATWNAFKPR